jgi:deoxyadenosine kinase
MSDQKHISYSDMFSPKHINIAISGIIGAGKSTLCKNLGDIMNCDVFYEPVKENPYLEKFYKDMKKYACIMQIYLLKERFNKHQQMVWSQRNIIQDRSIYEDVIFAKMLRESGDIDELDFETYRDLYSAMTSFLRQPDLIVYLDVKPEIALKRIKKRSRNCETSIPLSYLENLQKGYEEWLEDVDGRIPVLKLDWNEFMKAKDVANLISKELGKKGHKLIL